jgi:hypothetical protein
MKTIAEQIAAFEAKRAANVARMNEIQTKAIEAGRSKEADEKEEFDQLGAEVETIDSELKDLRLMEKQQSPRRRRQQGRTAPIRRSRSCARGGARVSKWAMHADPRQAESREGHALRALHEGAGAGKGIPHLAQQIAEANQVWKETSPEVAMVLKAAVAAGDTTTAGWASELVYNQNLAGAFLEYLRPQTILGKIEGMTQVPFNVRWGTQTGGATGYWVGQGSPTPVSKLATGRTRWASRRRPAWSSWTRSSS